MVEDPTKHRGLNSVRRLDGSEVTQPATGLQTTGLRTGHVGDIRTLGGGALTQGGGQIVTSSPTQVSSNKKLFNQLTFPQFKVLRGNGQVTMLPGYISDSEGTSNPLVNSKHKVAKTTLTVSQDGYVMVNITVSSSELMSTSLDSGEEIEIYSYFYSSHSVTFVATASLPTAGAGTTYESISTVNVPIAEISYDSGKARIENQIQEGPINLNPRCYLDAVTTVSP